MTVAAPWFRHMHASDRLSDWGRRLPLVLGQREEYSSGTVGSGRRQDFARWLTQVLNFKSVQYSNCGNGRCRFHEEGPNQNVANNIRANFSEQQFLILLGEQVL
eukprot:g55493.t1